MSDHTDDFRPAQEDLFDSREERSLLSKLIAESRLYRKGRDYKELLDFVVRLRNMAPFNAMLLQVQKPGLKYAASARDWRLRFGRHPKEAARPLLIMWPFSPVALVYDIVDTEGKDVPPDAFSFVAHGPIDSAKLQAFRSRLARNNIDWLDVDAGDGRAGLIRVVKRAVGADDHTRYRMHVNRNHDPAIQFVTLAHELAHLFLGHLGPDKKLGVPHRVVAEHSRQELEAESVAFVVSHRNGVTSRSHVYLSNYIDSDDNEQLDVHQVMRAADRVESILDLAPRTTFDS
jgi:hypothetical protein